MKPLLVACSIMKDEVNAVLERHGLEDAYDVRWMPESLHNTPQNMTAELQAVIDAEPDRPRILMSYGNCGNGLVGVQARGVEIVMPRYADCISMLLHERDDIDRLRTNTIFLTRGWLDGEYGLEQEYEQLVQRKGQKRADKIMSMLYEHYENIMLIDTGCYDLEAQKPRVESIGKRLGLRPCGGKGSISVLERLVTGDWGEDFLVLQPGCTVGLKDYFQFGTSA